MIRQALPDEKALIYSMWKDAFSFDDNGSIDHYFQAYYRDHQSYVLIESGVIVCSLQTREKKMELHGKVIRVNYIVGIVTLAEHRHKGYMRQLLDAVLEESRHHYLITVLQAYEPRIYEPFGFENVMDVKETTLEGTDLAFRNSVGVSMNIKAADLKQCYDRFTRYFTGYFKRSEEEFKTLVEGFYAEGGEVIGYLKDNVLEGYAFISKHEQVTRYDELCYMSSDALLRLASFGLQQSKQVILVTSPQEKIKRVFPHAVSKKRPFMMARINNPVLFESLYHVRIISAYSAFRASPLPLFNRDYQ